MAGHRVRRQIRRFETVLLKKCFKHTVSKARFHRKTPGVFVPKNKTPDAHSWKL